MTKNDFKSIKEMTLSFRFFKFALRDILDIDVFRSAKENSTSKTFLDDVERLENEIEESIKKLRRMKEHLEKGKKAFKEAQEKSVKVVKRGGNLKQYNLYGVKFFTTPKTMERIHRMSEIEVNGTFDKRSFDEKIEYTLKQGFVDYSKFEMALGVIDVSIEQYARLAEDKEIVFDTVMSVEDLGDDLHHGGMVFSIDEEEEEEICKDGEKYRQACIELGKSELERGGLILFPNIGLFTILNW